MDIVNRLAAQIGEDVKQAKPSDDGWPIVFHLCHMHEVRQGWLNEVSKKHAEGLADVFFQKDGKWHCIEDLAEVRRHLAQSGKAVGDAVKELIESGAGKAGPYSHPIHFMNHMLWHDGWHYGLIALALRLSGRELDEEWEEDNAWAIWRS